MFNNIADQLWAEIIKCMNKKELQDKVRELAVIPIIKQLIAQIYPYFIVICVLFVLIIILLIILIIRGTKV